MLSSSGDSKYVILYTNMLEGLVGLGRDKWFGVIFLLMSRFKHNSNAYCQESFVSFQWA